MVWLMVSKAAERSKRVRREIWPESVFKSKLLEEGGLSAVVLKEVVG